MWQPAFGRHNLMNRHILKPLSIRQLSYGFHKKKTRGICPSGCLLKCFTHTQMHQLLLCLDESPLTKLCWGLSDVWNSTCPNTKPLTPSDGSLPDLQSLDYRLMLHVICLLCCVRVWLLIFGGHSWAESTVHIVLGVLVRMQFIIPKMLTGKSNSSQAVTWHPLNHYPSLKRVCERTKPKLLRHSKSHSGSSKNQSKWRKREFTEVGWRCLTF